MPFDYTKKRSLSEVGKRLLAFDLLPYLKSMARPAGSLLGSNVSVFWGKFMSMLAMGSSKLVGDSLCDGYLPRTSISNLPLFDDKFEGESFRCPAHYRVSFDTIFLTQVRRFVFNPINGENSRLSLISSLIFSACPPAILRGVRSVIIYSVDREACRSIAHVRDKSPEVIGPSLAYNDTPAAVVSVKLVTLVGASASHAIPSLVKVVLSSWRVWQRHNSHFGDGYGTITSAALPCNRS